MNQDEDSQPTRGSTTTTRSPAHSQHTKPCRNPLQVNKASLPTVSWLGHFSHLCYQRRFFERIHKVDGTHRARQPDVKQPPASSTSSAVRA